MSGVMLKHSISTVLLVCCVSVILAADPGAPPGVNPNQYRQQQQAQQIPQHQQQQQQLHQNPPGVNPQQYQQQQQQYQPPPPPPPPQQQYQQQYQQPPQQQQQQPSQQQQPPQQQQQQPPQQQQQQYQQQPPQQQQQYQQQQGGPHAQAVNGQKMLHKPSLSGERDHIKDHLEVPLDTSGMSEQELQFHYFKMHDADDNNRLDGQELIKSLFHWHDADNHDPAKDKLPAANENKLFTDDELSTMIDPILEQDDHNKDGYIDYGEFMAAQQKAANNAEAAAATAKPH